MLDIPVYRTYCHVFTAIVVAPVATDLGFIGSGLSAWQSAVAEGVLIHTFFGGGPKVAMLLLTGCFDRAFVQPHLRENSLSFMIGGRPTIWAVRS